MDCVDKNVSDENLCNDITENNTKTINENESRIERVECKCDTENKEIIKKLSLFDRLLLIFITLVLIATTASNCYTSWSVNKMHAFTMQFVSDVFYYQPDSNQQE